MIKEILRKYGLPAVSLTALSCESSLPNLSGNVNSQCGADPQLKTAELSIRMVPNQEVIIGASRFKLTGKGRLVDTNNTKVELERGVVKNYHSTYDADFNKRYAVDVTLGEDASVVTVSLNCQNPLQDSDSFSQ